MQPTIRTATMDEIKAILPKDLFHSLEVDPAGQNRLKMVVRTCELLNLAPILKIESKETSPEGLAAAKKIWDGQQLILKHLSNTLDAGKLENLRSDVERHRLNTFVTFHETVTGLIACSRQLAGGGDFKSASDCLALCYKFSSAIIQARGRLIDYLLGYGLQHKVLNAIQELAQSKSIPIQDCGQLLRALPPSPVADGALNYAMCSDFQNYTLPRLLNPTLLGGA